MTCDSATETRRCSGRNVRGETGSIMCDRRPAGIYLECSVRVWKLRLRMRTHTCMIATLQRWLMSASEWIKTATICYSTANGKQHRIKHDETMLKPWGSIVYANPQCLLSQVYRISFLWIIASWTTQVDHFILIGHPLKYFKNIWVCRI